MQSSEIKALELEASALAYLDGFVRDHALWFLVGVIYLLLALLTWVLSGGLRRKGGSSTAYYIRPTVVIHQMQSPPPPAEPQFEAFRPLRNPPEYDPEEDWD